MGVRTQGFHQSLDSRRDNVLSNAMISSECLLACLAVTIIVSCATAFFLLTSTHDYWKRRTIPYIAPSFPFGNFGSLLTGRASFTQLFNAFYKEFKQHGFGGVYNVREPVLVVCNPELIKYILTKDFNSFHDRGLPYDKKNDPFSANLFNLSGQEWRTLRAKLSPTFTSGKMRAMFPLIQECAKQLKDCLRNEINDRHGSVEMKDFLVRYTTDVIGTCAFGINCNSIKNPQAEFHVMSREIFEQNLAKTLRFIALAVSPKLIQIFPMRRLFSKTTAFFTELMDRTVKHRRENNIQRNDFVDLMMKILDEEKDGVAFNQDLMAAQAFLFFVAGLDNVANNIGFCLHALAVDPDLQDRVYSEICTTLEEYGGKLCYEAVSKMNLVGRVLDEGLRMYTPTGVLIRTITVDKYTIPGTCVELEKGTCVMIPIQSVHYDEEYFPNAMKFDPERFTDEEKSKRHPYAYLPFGEGPRFCVASRFAQLEMRMCLVELLRHFNFSIAPETDLSLQLDIKAFGPLPIKNFWLRISERST